MSARKLTAKRVRELLDCNPAAGELWWKERPGNPSFNAQWAGKRVGALDPTTRLPAPDDRRDPPICPSHRVDVCPRPAAPRRPRSYRRRQDELRHLEFAPASKAQNNSNRRVARKTIGPRGYWLNPKAGMFQVNIGVGGRSVYLGAYRFPEAAEKAYREAAEELHGAFAFTSRPRPSLSCGGLRDGPAARKTGAGARTAAPGASRDRRHTCARSR